MHEFRGALSDDMHAKQQSVGDRDLGKGRGAPLVANAGVSRHIFDACQSHDFVSVQ
jgi:hypothetical protein